MNVFFTILFASLLCLSSCVEKKSKSKSSTTTTTTLSSPTPTPTPTDSGYSFGNNSGSGNGSTGTNTVIDTTCNAPGVGSTQLSDYYRVSSVIRGRGGPGLNWSTLTEPFFANDNQNLLITDSRLNARIVVRPSPGGGPGGSNCSQMAMDYTKLSFRVGLKASAAAPYYQTRSFSNILVDQCSQVIEFLTPAVNNPLVVEVYDIRWDACVNGPGTCAVDYVWPYDCVEIEVQISTDYTRDIPH